MKHETVNMHEAKTHFSRLVKQVEGGEEVIISRNGVPVAKLVRVDAPRKKKIQRTGFMKGEIEVPDNFDDIMADEIADMFYGSDNE